MGPKLPNIIVLTDVCISTAHGTGTTLLRHFAGYPAEKLLNIYWLTTGEPGFQNNVPVPIKVEQIRTESIPARLWRRIIKYIPLSNHPSVQVSPPSRLDITMPPIRPLIEQQGFKPDIIYANCFGLHGLTVLAQLIQEYEGKLPVIQHFHDYQRYTEQQQLEDLLRTLSPHLHDVWALTPALAEEMTRVISREVKIVNTFRGDVPAQYKNQHYEFSQEFRAVIMGNIWLPALAHDLCEAWQWIGEALGGIQPIQWFCHPESIAYVPKYGNGREVGPEIQYGGFFQGEALQEKLRQADISIIPFNREETPENDYARFSLPSRITETASAGLPMFVAAGSKTGTARYVTQHGIGVCAAPSNKEHFREALITFIKDQQLRAECGRRARTLAEQEFDIKKYRSWLYGKLSEFAQNADK